MEGVTQPMKRTPTTNNLRGMLQRNTHRQAVRFGDRCASTRLFAAQVLHGKFEGPLVPTDHYSLCSNQNDVPEPCSPKVIRAGRNNHRPGWRPGPRCLATGNSAIALLAQNDCTPPRGYVHLSLGRCSLEKKGRSPYITAKDIPARM
jgi:hypothetical protein